MTDGDAVAVIGTGNVGRALGGGWAAAGYDVTVGSRSARDPDDDLRAFVDDAGATLATPAEAAATADAVVLAVPGGAAVDVAAGLADAVADAGAVVVDATNGPVPAGRDSLGAAVAAAVDAPTAKGFNTIGHERMRDPSFPDGTASMLLCGDEAAVAAAAALADALGFDPVAAGGIDAARHLEALARAWIHLAGRHGRDVGFRLLGVERDGGGPE